MKKFELGNNTLYIKFPGVEFKRDPALVEAEMGAAQKAIDDFNVKINSGTADKEAIEEIIATLIDRVETALEKGAVKKIIGDKKSVSLHDMCDIVIYIRMCASEFEQRKREEYKSYSLNRDSRRQGNKK